MVQKMIEGLDYCFIYPKDDKHSVHIKLLDGPYKNTTLKYGKVKFMEQDGQVSLHFAFDVLESPFMEPKRLVKDHDFIQFAGDMLRDMMGGTQEIIDENRIDDSEEPYLL